MDIELRGGILKHQVCANHSAGTWVCRLPPTLRRGYRCLRLGTAMGAVLSQVQDGRTRIIAYASRGLSKAEKNQSNYSSKKLELLNLKWAVCDKFMNYLLGGQFTLYTDNNPLTYLMKSVKLPAVEQRWAAALAPFHFEIRYRAAKHNANADALSRLPQVSTPKTDVDSCFEELTHTTQLPATLGINVLEAEVNPEIVGDGATGTLPSISPADMRIHQEADEVLRHVLRYHRLGRRPDAMERCGEAKATLALFALGDKLIEREGVLYRQTAYERRQCAHKSGRVLSWYA